MKWLSENSGGQSNELQLTATRGRAMKQILILIAISLFLCATSSAQGGGGESTKPKPNPKKTSVTKPNNTTPVRPAAPPARPSTPTAASVMVNSGLPNVIVTLNGRTLGTTPYPLPSPVTHSLRGWSNYQRAKAKR
jgi:hypothetical protein